MENLGSSQNIVEINDLKVEFLLTDEDVFCTSLDIAKVFKKAHKNVLRDIDNILKGIEDENYRQLNFELSSKVCKNGFYSKETKIYKLTRDGFSLVAMGFTGKRALQFKIKFIEAFNYMQKVINNQLERENKHLNKILKEVYKVLPQKDFKLKISVLDLNQERKQGGKELLSLNYQIGDRS